MSCLSVRRVSHRRCSEERLSGLRSSQCVWLHPYVEGLKWWSWRVTGDSHRDEVALFESRDGQWGKKDIGVTAWLQKKLPYGTPQGLVTSARVLRRRSFIRRYCSRYREEKIVSSRESSGMQWKNGDILKLNGLVGVCGLVAARKCWILLAHGKGQRTLFQEGQCRSPAKWWGDVCFFLVTLWLFVRMPARMDIVWCVCRCPGAWLGRQIRAVPQEEKEWSCYSHSRE